MPLIETADRAHLFYKDWGRGRCLVFIHGWALNADIWEYQMAPLKQRGLRCVAYDRRGCGRSSQPGHGYDYDTFADDLAVLLERLDLRQVTLVAHSMGGGDAVRYLSRHGASRVAGLVLLAATTPCLLRTGDNPDGIEPAVFDGMIAALAHDRPGFMAASAPTFFGEGAATGAVSPALMAWAVGLALQACPIGLADMVRAFSATDFRPELAQLTVPTLIVHGDADPNVPVELCGRRTARLVPGSRLEVYEGAPHGLMVTHRDRLNADLLAFASG